VYAQTGATKEHIQVNGDVLKSSIQSLVNTVNLFGPGADLSTLQRQYAFGSRERKKTVIAATLSGDSGDLFQLPAGPVGFSLGAESRRKAGAFNYNPELPLLFNQSVPATPGIPPSLRANEFYGELLVPLLAKLSFIENLSRESALRGSAYSKSIGENKRCSNDKIDASWAVTQDFRMRATQQTVIREPNFGEFANPTVSIPFNSLVNVARLRLRYPGTPCVLGPGNAEQCARFKAPAVGTYNSFDPALLTGGYFFDGNPDIRAETGKTKTFGAVITPSAIKGLTINFGVDNVAAKQPPTPKNPSTFNTYTDTYNVLGGTYGLSLTYKM